MEQKEFARKVGERIAYFRKQKGWTQAELGLKISKEYQQVSNFETGRYVMSLYLAQQIANALDITVNDLLDF